MHDIIIWQSTNQCPDSLFGKDRVGNYTTHDHMGKGRNPISRFFLTVLPEFSEFHSIDVGFIIKIIHPCNSILGKRLASFHWAWMLVNIITKVGNRVGMKSHKQSQEVMQLWNEL
jgi:hypothetical protein